MFCAFCEGVDKMVFVADLKLNRRLVCHVYTESGLLREDRFLDWLLPSRYQVHSPDWECLLAPALICLFKTVSLPTSVAGWLVSRGRVSTLVAPGVFF
jgi:hypothetical protein